MKSVVPRTLLGLAVVLLCAAFVEGQNRERFGISAQAGGVNAVSGQVTVKHEGQAPRLMTSQDNLSSGDVVNTGYGSQAEILLNPGTYLRLAENTEFVLVDNSLDNLLVRLNEGSAIIEATGPGRVELHIPIVTAHERLTIISAGIYRINVTPEMTQLLVQKGRVTLGGDPRNVVKGGMKLTIRGSAPPVIAKATKNDRDDFDIWSKERGKTLAAANARLSTRGINGLIASSRGGWPSMRTGRWGFWTWSSFARCYTFMPFYWGWGSPYGGYYGLYAGFGGYYPDGSCCRTYVYSQPGFVGTQSGNNPGAASITGSAQPQPGTISEKPSVAPPPPPPPMSVPAPQPQTLPDYGKGSRIKDPD